VKGIGTPMSGALFISAYILHQRQKKKGKKKKGYPMGK
jgi:hypothetical protein